MIPFFVGLTILAIGVCFGFNCGYAINPARDFAPRLFTCEKCSQHTLSLTLVFQCCLAGVLMCSPTLIIGGSSRYSQLISEPSWEPGFTIWQLVILHCVNLSNDISSELNFPPVENFDESNGIDLGHLRVSNLYRAVGYWNEIDIASASTSSACIQRRHSWQRHFKEINRVELRH